MSRGDVSTESGGDAAGAMQGKGKTGRSVASRATRAARWVVGSGALAGVVGGGSLVRGFLALRRGERGRGLAHVAVGGLLVVVAVLQRRAGSGDVGEADVDQSDVVDTAPDVEDVAGTPAGPARHAGGDAASEVVDSSTDVEDVATDRRTDRDEGTAAGEVEDETTTDEVTDETTTDEVEDETATDEVEAGERGAAADETMDDGMVADETTAVETEGESTGDESAEGETTGDETSADEYHRLGEAAYDEHGREVPVPQRALNMGLLSPNSEAFWGVREADDAVLVAGRFDPLQDGDGVRYVGSSELDGERTLSVPDAVTDHWDAVAGGGTAVVSGTGLVFATSGRLRDDDQLLVVPESQVEDVLGRDE